MKIKVKKLLSYLKRSELSNSEFAQALGVSLAEVEKMLAGKAVGINTARKFIYYFSAEDAQHYIDWEAIGTENPLSDEKNNDESEDDEDDEKFERNVKEK